jgi:glycosyltransferase involved in cell wall biosynthesis
METNSRAISILWGEVHWNHIGPHSGLRPLSRLVGPLHPGTLRRISARTQRPSTPLALLRRKLNSLIHPQPEWARICATALPLYSAESWELENAIGKAIAAREPDVLVLEGVEEQFYRLAAERPRWRRTRILGISHQTPAWLRLHYRRPELAKSLDAMVVFSSAARDHWASLLDPAKVHFLHHGVDIDFFTPPAQPRRADASSPLRVLFSGHWMRDFDTLIAVVSGVEAAGLNVVFDVLVPHKVRDTAACYRLAISPLVRWHADLSDEALRDLYRGSDLVLLPLEDSTANNALLEGMACGRPVIVTDIGGVRDYISAEAADLVPPRDPAAILQLLARYAADRDSLADRGGAARKHAEALLSWPMAADRFDSILCSLAAV